MKKILLAVGVAGCALVLSGCATSGGNSIHSLTLPIDVAKSGTNQEVSTALETIHNFKKFENEIESEFVLSLSDSATDRRVGHIEHSGSKEIKSDAISLLENNLSFHKVGKDLYNLSQHVRHNNNEVLSKNWVVRDIVKCNEVKEFKPFGYDRISKNAKNTYNVDVVTAKVVYDDGDMISEIDNYKKGAKSRIDICKLDHNKLFVYSKVKYHGFYEVNRFIRTIKDNRKNEFVF